MSTRGCLKAARYDRRNHKEGALPKMSARDTLLELRMAVAEAVLRLAWKMMPKDHPHYIFWCKAVLDASRNIMTSEDN